LEEFISLREFAEVRCRVESHHFGLRCVELKAFRRAPVMHGRHTSHKPSSHPSTDLGWLALLSALHVGKQMVADAVLLENLGDVLSIGDEGSQNKL
jgi:hypothetical protein